MRLADKTLRDRLAAEYVLGTMSPRARRRFSAMVREIPALRHAVADWESRLAPLVNAVPDLQPPPRVWKTIESRIRGGRTAPSHGGFWQSLSFWRLSSFASGALALALLLLIVSPQQQVPETVPGRMVVVMNDLQTLQPAMTATWEHGRPGERVVRLRVIGHAEMAPNTSWELWMLPGASQNPVSLGLITTHETQTVVVPAALAAKLDAAEGLAMSVEPASGSPTGLPTGPVLYAGKAIET